MKTTNNERTGIIFERVEAAITLLRVIRNRAQKGKHVDPSEFSDLNELVASLRHHCEAHNTERINQICKPLGDIL